MHGGPREDVEQRVLTEAVLMMRLVYRKVTAAHMRGEGKCEYFDTKDSSGRNCLSCRLQV